MNTGTLHVNDLPMDVLLMILELCPTKYTMLVCTYWNALIDNNRKRMNALRIESMEITEQPDVYTRPFIIRIRNKKLDVIKNLSNQSFNGTVMDEAWKIIPEKLLITISTKDGWEMLQTMFPEWWLKNVKDLSLHFIYDRSIRYIDPIREKDTRSAVQFVGYFKMLESLSTNFDEGTTIFASNIISRMPRITKLRLPRVGENHIDLIIHKSFQLEHLNLVKTSISLEKFTKLLETCNFSNRVHIVIDSVVTSIDDWKKWLFCHDDQCILSTGSEDVSYEALYIVSIKIRDSKINMHLWFICPDNHSAV